MSCEFVDRLKKTWRNTLLALLVLGAYPQIVTAQSPETTDTIDLTYLASTPGCNDKSFGRLRVTTAFYFTHPGVPLDRHPVTFVLDQNRITFNPPNSPYPFRPNIQLLYPPPPFYGEMNIGLAASLDSGLEGQYYRGENIATYAGLRFASSFQPPRYSPDRPVFTPNRFALTTRNERSFEVSVFSAPPETPTPSTGSIDTDWFSVQELCPE